MLADFAPMVVGLKVTLMVQVAPGMTVPQLVVWANCVGLVPVRVTPDITRFALPMLLIVIVCATETVPFVTEPKASEVGETTATGAGATAVPLKVILEGAPAALWVMVTAADLAPIVMGEKTTLMVQESPGKTVPQVFVVIPNSPALAPISVKPDTRRLAFPVLVTVTTFAADVNPVGCDPNVSDAGEACATGAGTGLVLVDDTVSSVPWLSV